MARERDLAVQPLKIRAKEEEGGKNRKLEKQGHLLEETILKQE